MRWRWPIILVLAGTGGVLALSAVLSSSLSSRFIHPFILPVLEERLGPGTTVRSVTIHLLPPSLVLDHLVVPRSDTLGPRGGPDAPLLTANRVTASLLPWRPANLTVEEPVLVVSGSLGRLGHLITSQPGRAAGRTRLRHGAVTVIEPTSGRRLELTAVDADLTTGLPGADLTVSAKDIRFALPGSRPQFTEMTARLRLTLRTVELVSLAFTGPRSYVTVAGRITLDPPGEPRLDLATDAALDLGEMGRPGGLNGQARFSAKVQGTSGAPVAEGTVALMSLTVENRAIGQFIGLFSYREGRLLVTDVNAKLFEARVAGPIEFSHGHLVIPSVQWRDRTMGRFTADLERQGDRLVIQQAVLGQGPAIYRTHGTVAFTDPTDPMLDLQVEVVRLDPTLILGHNALTTEINGQGRLTGPLGAFASRWALTLKRGRVYGIRFDRGGLQVALERGGVTITALTLERGAPRRAGATWLRGSGRIEKGDLVSVDAEIRNWDPGEALRMIRRREAAPLRALVGGRRLSGRLHGAAMLTGFTFQFETPAHSRWEAVIRPHRVEFTGTANLTSFEGRVERASGYPIRLMATLSGAPVSPILERISRPLSRAIGGFATGRVHAAGRLDNIKSWTAEGTLTSLRLMIAGVETWNAIPLVMVVHNKRIELAPVVLVGRETSLTVSGVVNLPDTLEVAADGEVGLSFLKVFAPYVSEGRGAAQLTLRVAGPLSDPMLSGRLVAYDGEIDSAILAKTMHLSALSLRFDDHTISLDTLEGERDRGQFLARGHVRLARLAPEAFSLRLRLTEIAIERPPNLAGVVSGDLRLEGTRNSMELSGDLTVLRGLYEDRLKTEPFLAAFDSLFRAIAKTSLDIKILGSENIRFKRLLETDPPIMFESPVTVDLHLKGTVREPLLFGKVLSKTGTVFYSRQ